MRTRNRPLGALAAGAAAATVLALAGPATAAVPGGDAQGTIRHAEAANTVDGSYIVALKGDASLRSGARAATRTVAKGLVADHGGRVEHVYAAAFHGFALHATPAQARELAADPAVRYVSADRTAHAVGEQADPPSWGLDRIDGALDGSYAYPNQGDGVTAYILDTGVDLSHPEFEGRASSGYDFIDDDGNASDCQGHGTHVAGTVGSQDYGVAKNVDIVSVRVLDCQGRGSYSDIIAGVDWVADHASGPSVANMSLEGPGDSSFDQAVRGAISAGVSISVAAGNSSTDACGSSPARVSEAITLGATDRDDGRSSFSNYGSCLDLFAPGRNITSTRNGGGSTQMSGTSMASPHSTGAAALYLSAHPDAGPAQVEDALVAAAQSGVVGDPGPGSPNVLLNVSGLGEPGDPGDPGDPSGEAPTASFTVSCWYEACDFDASGSSDADGDIASYGWKFGDGKTGSGATVSHGYPAGAGDYTAELTVTDEAGNSDTVTRQLQCWDFGGRAFCFA